MFPWLAAARPRVVDELVAEALYAPYLARQAESLRMLQAEERLAVPAGLDFTSVPGLSLEMRQRLDGRQAVQPGRGVRVCRASRLPPSPRWPCIFGERGGVFHVKPAARSGARCFT